MAATTINRTNPKACDFCGLEKVIMLTLENGFQICAKCRIAREKPTEKR